MTFGGERRFERRVDQRRRKLEVGVVLSEQLR